MDIWSTDSNRMHANLNLYDWATMEKSKEVQDCHGNIDDGHRLTQLTEYPENTLKDKFPLMLGLVKAILF